MRFHPGYSVRYRTLVLIFQHEIGDCFQIARIQNTAQRSYVQIQRYLLVTLVSNVLVAVATWLAFQALGMEQAGAWGVAAGVLHFVPYLGPALTALASGVAGFFCNSARRSWGSP
jgi:predicted PurR-regulated permease PerM